MAIELSQPSTHTVITGHRGLPGRRHTTRLDEMVAAISLPEGHGRGSVAYQVDDISVIKLMTRRSVRVARQNTR